jgi:hypothetical protein
LQIYPTLTTDQFHITYELKESVDLRIRLFSLSGQLVNDLTKADGGLTQPGTHDVNVSMKAENLAAGIYFLQFDYPGFSKNFKLVLLPKP